MLRLIFPPKCTLCRTLLRKDETDLCHSCRTHAPTFKRAKRKIPNIAQWTAIWYYKDDVRKSIHRFKFGNARSYAEVYARLLAVKLQEAGWEPVDLVTWVPISTLRYLKRGYDQSELIANALGKELGVPTAPVLKRIRHAKPLSGIQGLAHRSARIRGAYKLLPEQDLADKRILLLDDVITTGATGTECGKLLASAKVKKVYFAAVAAASDD